MTLTNVDVNGSAQPPGSERFINCGAAPRAVNRPTWGIFAACGTLGGWEGLTLQLAVLLARSAGESAGIFLGVQRELSRGSGNRVAYAQSMRLIERRSLSC